MHKYNLVFGELVRSGIPVSEALDTAVGMVDNLAIKEQLLSVNANSTSYGAWNIHADVGSW